MLYDLQGQAITKIPYYTHFQTLLSRLTEAEVEAVVARIDELIEASGNEIVTAGWLPGSNWKNTPFQVLYTKAAKMNTEIAAKFFGQLVWFTIMQRPEKWASGRFEIRGQPISSRTYFRLRMQ